MSPNMADDTTQETKIATTYLMKKMMKRDMNENEDGSGLSSEVWSTGHTTTSSGYSCPQYEHFFIRLMRSCRSTIRSAANLMSISVHAFIAYNLVFSTGPSGDANP